MAILKNLLVNGSARFLNILYANDLTVSGTTTFADLSVTGNAVVGGTLNVGNGNNANTIIKLNGKQAIAGVNGTSYTWLRINDTNAFTSGVYFGSSIVRTDGSFQIGNAGANINMTTSAATFKVPININGTTYKWTTDGNIVANGITATNANINKGIFHNAVVEGTLYAVHQEIDHVANLGGVFLVTPTVKCISSGSNKTLTSVTVTASSTTRTNSDGESITYNYSLQINDSAFSTASIGGNNWVQYGEVKVSGNINGTVLGTCDGFIQSINTNTHVLTVAIKYNGDQTLATPSDISTVEDLNVMLKTVYDSSQSKHYPVGIWMKSRDANGYSHISLYGGTSVDPTVRIGNLQGCPTINGESPTGWGIFTNNGYFSGMIVSNSGKIGNFTISDALYSTAKAFGTTANNVYIGDDGISLGTTFKVTKAGALTATSGSIGGSVTIGGTAASTILSNITNAAKTATNYLTTISGTTGISVHNSGDTNNFVNMNSNGVFVYKGGTQRAQFADTTIIGKPYVDGVSNNESHVEIDYHSLQLLDREGEAYFHISDLREANGIAPISITFIGDGENKNFSLPLPATNNTYTVTVSDSSGGTISKSDLTITFSTAPTAGANIYVNYETTSRDAKAYTIGYRGIGNVGPQSYALGWSVDSEGFSSFAEGVTTTASGYASHAEGSNTTASYYYSHAEGYETIASKEGSHAEGYRTVADGGYSHAEGYNTKATGGRSHAEGQDSEALGTWSHAEGAGTIAEGKFSHAEGRNTVATHSAWHSHTQNQGTVAIWPNQTVIGTYNYANVTGSGTTDDPYIYEDVGNYAFIIGNGIEESRSNALTVDWGGNVNISGTYQKGGSAFITTQSFDLGTISITAGTPGTTSTTITKTITKTGYTPIAVKIRYVSTSMIGFNAFFNSDNTGLYVQVIRRQTGASSPGYKAYADVTYIKT